MTCNMKDLIPQILIKSYITKWSVKNGSYRQLSSNYFRMNLQCPCISSITSIIVGEYKIYISKNGVKEISLGVFVWFDLFSVFTYCSLHALVYSWTCLQYETWLNPYIGLSC